ncbi:MAG: hypothetical protein U5L08_14805 [Xanthomonadales bacterium]|nr:hypothetical protein [Xanthomonadales bacterium]
MIWATGGIRTRRSAPRPSTPVATHRTTIQGDYGLGRFEDA